MRKLDLDDEAAYRYIDDIANEESEFVLNDMFFFGKLYTDNIDEELISQKALKDGAIYVKCPLCGHLEEISEEKAESYTPYTCKSCGQEGTLYDFRDQELPLSDVAEYHVGVFEEWEDNSERGCLLRIFSAAFDFSQREYDNHFTLDCFPELRADELYREYWHDGNIEYYKKAGEGWDRCEAEDVDEEYCSLIGFDDMEVCYLEDVTYRTEYRTFMEALSANTPLQSYRTLNKYGFRRLAEDCLCTSQNNMANTNKISRLLGVDYNRLIKEYAPEEVTRETLVSYKEVEKLGLIPSKKNISIYDALKARTPKIYSKKDAPKVFKYLRNNANKYGGKSINDYIDYIKNMKDLGYDVNASDVRFPADLKKAHDRAAEEYLVKRDKIKYANFLKTVEKYSFLDTFSAEKFEIRLAHTPNELRKEGDALHHCVGTYADRIGDRCLIFFIREKEAPDVSFYTLEFDPNRKKVVQCRGEHNENYENDQALVMFVAVWLDYAVRQLKKVQSR